MLAPPQHIGKFQRFERAQWNANRVMGRGPTEGGAPGITPIIDALASCSRLEPDLGTADGQKAMQINLEEVVSRSGR
jgi:hypothetical protein